MTLPFIRRLICRVGAAWRNAPRPWNEEQAWRRRENNVDAVRALLALFVIWFHSPVLLGDASDTPILPHFAQEPGEQLHFVGVRVLCFFWLSGFLLTRSWERLPHVGTFIMRRVLRLYPPFLVCAAFCLLLVLPIVSGAALPPRNTTLLSLLTFRIPGVEGAFPHNDIDDTLNGSLWTLLYEGWCCTLLLLLGILGIIRQGKLLILLLIGAWMTYVLQWFGVLLFPLRWENSNTWTAFGAFEAYPRLLTCFLSGVAFYRYRDRIPWHPALFTVAVGILLLAISLGMTGPAIPIFGAYCLAGIAFHPRRLFPKWLFSWGDLSYGIFLYGYPIQQMGIHYFGSDISAVTLFCLTLPPVLLLAYLSRHLVENPIELWQKSLQKRYSQKKVSTTVPAYAVTMD